MRKNKRIMIFLGHPSQYYVFKNAMRILKNRGFEIDLLVNNKDILKDLLDESGTDYCMVRKKERKGRSKVAMALSCIQTEWNIFCKLISKRPALCVGSCMSFVEKCMGIPVVNCNDDDAYSTPIYAKLIYPYVAVILSPASCDNGKWNKKTINYCGYQKLAYLHPNHFQPDLNIVKKYMALDKPYFIMRFSSFQAYHDDGYKGIHLEIAKNIIGILNKYGNVYITSERELDPELEKYRLVINPTDIHHVLAFAELYIGDSQSMAVEAAMLGVPCVRYNAWVGTVGVMIELEEKYHLMRSVKAGNPEKLYQTIIEMMATPGLREQLQGSRKKMLSESIDVTAFLVWFIEHYPESKSIMKNNPDYQLNFK